MRIFAFIFSFYLLALSVMPCSDAHTDCDNSKSKTTLVQNHEHRNDANDFCSPFCNCNCCSSITTFSGHHFNQRPVQPALIKPEKFSSGDFFFTSSYNGNIWQPPRILG